MSKWYERAQFSFYLSGCLLFSTVLAAVWGSVLISVLIILAASVAGR